MDTEMVFICVNLSFCMQIVGYIFVFNFYLISVFISDKQNNQIYA